MLKLSSRLPSSYRRGGSLDRLMANTSPAPASYGTQANALFRKSLIFQKRNMKTNIRLVSFPLFVCLLIFIIQTWIDNELDKPSLKCGCTCANTNADGKCTRKVCGVEYSTVDQVGTCSVPRPSAWVPLLQIPAPEYRAVDTKFFRSNDLPKESCRRLGSCPGTILLTGNNSTFGRSLGASMFAKSFALDSSDATGSLASNLVGSPTSPELDNFYEPGFASSLPLYYAQSQCTSRPNFSVPILLASISISKELRCVQGIHLWRNSSSGVNDDLYKGFRKGNTKGMINEMVAAYDFLNSNSNNFNASVWYNSTYNNEKDLAAIRLVRVPRSVNLVSNAYLQFLKGAGTKMLLNFVKETPKVETPRRVDFSAILGPVFFTWVILQLFPVILASLVYEKEQNLRIMMKMHGLRDGPYWMISYFYFLVVSTIYMLCFVVFGSIVDLKIFTLNDYVIQLVFYFIFINLQIALAFLAAAMFSNVRTATVIAYIFVFGTGLLGGFLFHFFIQDITFPGGWITVMQLYPGFSLYRGLYEFAQYSYTGTFMGTYGMRWVNMSDGENGMKDVLIIMVVEWAVVLVVAFYIDQVLSSGRSPLFFVHNLRKKAPLSSFRKPSIRRQGCKITAQTEIEKLDVIQEGEKVEQLLLEPNSSHAIVCNNLIKVYPGKDGNPAKFAVKGLSLALPHGECFGMLGPNGAGKTSFISMMIGLTKPSSGMALVNGLDIRTDMDSIYTRMGVCLQHDLLWETLTGREHLFFYGRLKNLKGAALIQAVEESLDSVNLLYGGVGDKQAGKYSGGMKRRLSVAISLIGDPKVVYMDEPSTGLDPASRNNLWNVIKRAKQDRAIILTTHSMEEAEVLCDRLGIFVDGNLQCIGNAKELKSRYGGSYVLTVTTSADHDMEVEILARSLSLDAKRIYHIPGTQKFELPKHEVRIADVFQSVENAKSWFPVYAWGLADATLEDVFIKVVHGSQAFNVLS